MEPTLVAGQGLVAIRWPLVRQGQLRVLPHPLRPDLHLVKRVAKVDDHTMTVMSDNEDVRASDSRSFGSVPSDGTWLVVVAVPLRLMGGGRD